MIPFIELKYNEIVTIMQDSTRNEYSIHKGSLITGILVIVFVIILMILFTRNDS